ncbi:MAG: hypothetical protein IJC43_00980 [Clostridia bacterium]|nr:hypothetical protein [Clostridia bacterium]
MREEILDILQTQLGCAYLSDLRCGGSHCKEALHALLGYPAERFSLREWETAIGYITDREWTIPDQAALEALLSSLAESESASSDNEKTPV